MVKKMLAKMNKEMRERNRKRMPTVKMKRVNQGHKKMGKNKTGRTDISSTKLTANGGRRHADRTTKQRLAD